MLKKAVVVLVVAILIVFGFKAAQSTAQEPNIQRVKSPAVELGIEKVYIPCEDPSDPDCQPYPDNTNHPDPDNQNHELGLLGGGFPADTDVYIAGCINTSNGTRCTTGSEELNNLLNSLPGGDTMNPDPSHEFKTLTNPVQTDANGELTVIVRSFTPQVTTHIFNAYYIEEYDLTPTVITFNPSVTPEEALHLQGFAQLTKTPQQAKNRTRTNSSSTSPFTRCARLSCGWTPPPGWHREKNYDPKGRTFDIKSLEPVIGTQVTLLDNFKNLFSYENLTNPQIVKDNGEFNFWVPNGIYYLNFAKLPATHTWPVDLNRVHPNYSMAYYCDPDVKNSENEAMPLYYDQFSIIEFNKLVHCDVPIDPGTNTPFRSSVKTIDYGLNKSSSEGALYYSGKVSHPFTAVQLIAESSQKIVAEVEADKFGYWKITLLVGSYPLTADGLPDRVVLKYLKKDLTNANQYPAVAGVTFEPLLSYLEGYAYNKNNQIIPNAKVGVKQQNTDQIVYLATADGKGYFKIGSQFLPSLPYDLVFSDPSSALEIISTSQFAVANKQYLQDKKINLITAENTDVPLTTAKVTSFRTLQQRVGQGALDNETKPETSSQTPVRPSLMMVFTLLLLLTIIGIVAIRLLKTKRNLTPSNL